MCLKSNTRSYPNYKLCSRTVEISASITRLSKKKAKQPTQRNSTNCCSSEFQRDIPVSENLKISRSCSLSTADVYSVVNLSEKPIDKITSGKNSDIPFYHVLNHEIGVKSPQCQ